MLMVLANNGLNVIETLLSSALTDFDITHEEFANIIDEKIKYEGMKENIKNITSERVDRMNERVGRRETQL